MITTGFLELDSLMQGGIDDGELGIVSAGAGVGKSHFLIHFGSSAVKDKKRVWHVTFEIGKEAVDRRYNARLNSSEEVEKFIWIAEYPAIKLTIGDVYDEYEKLLGLDFKPDVFIIDYPQLMMNSKPLNSIYLELRNFGMCKKLPIWTAHQMSRSETRFNIINNPIPSADFVFNFQRSDEMDMSNKARLHVSKNRRGVGGISIPLHNVDFSKSYFEVDSDMYNSTTRSV